MSLIPMAVGLLLVLGGVAMLLHARSLRKALPPKTPDGALDGSLPEHGAFGLQYLQRDRASSLRRSGVRTIAVAGAVTLVSAWHALGH